jgi:hypothetical protein
MALTALPLYNFFGLSTVARDMNISAELCLQKVMSLSMTELFGGDGIAAIGDEVMHLI